MNPQDYPFSNQPARDSFAELPADTRREDTLRYAAQVAHAIAAASADERSASDETRERHLVFRLDDKDYAIPLANTLAIELPLATTELPFLPVWHTGIADLRGDIISVIDLRSLLGMSPAARTLRTRVIVVRPFQEETVVGLIVDATGKIRRLDSARFTAPTGEAESTFVRSMYESEDASLAVLDAEELLRALTLDLRIRFSALPIVLPATKSPAVT